MATYKEIKGTNIEVLSSDPSNPVEGQVWYNSTSNVLKGSVLAAAAWANGGNMNTARDQLAAAGNSPSSTTLIFGGDTTPHVANTELYNGSNWTEVNDLNTARRLLSGAGTNTAALAVSGFNGPPGSQNVAATETWNGTNWTEVNNLNTKRQYAGAAGIQTSALAFGGEGPPALAVTESWSVPSSTTKTISTD